MKILCCLFLAVFVFPLHASKWDVEYWQGLRWTQWKCDRAELYASASFRMNENITRPYYYRISQNIAYQAFQNLDLELHYSFIYHRHHSRGHFSTTNRLEIEVNPFVTLCHDIKLKSRNRIEFLKKQDVSYIEYVSRHRFMAVFPLKNCGKLKQISCSDEVFYHFKNNRFTQNRFIPLELLFELNSKSSFSLFLMIRNHLSSQRWHRSFVLGTEFDF